MSSLNESIKTIKTKPEYLKDIGVVGCLVMRHKVKGKGLYKIGGIYDSNFPRGLLTIKSDDDKKRSIFPLCLIESAGVKQGADWRNSNSDLPRVQFIFQVFKGSAKFQALIPKQ